MAIVASVVPEGLIVDTSVKCSKSLIAAVKAIGYLGIARYVPLPGVSAVEDIDAAELADILSAGLGSFWVQHPRFPGWKPIDHSAEVDALCACKAAQAAGYAPGTTGYVDCEGLSSDTTSAQAFYYNSQWAHVLIEEGFRAGLYDGYSNPETPLQLYEIRDVTSYWSDLANRKVAVRGCAVVQRAQITIDAVPFDPDEVRNDNLGGRPYWSIAA